MKHSINLLLIAFFVSLAYSCNTGTSEEQTEAPAEEINEETTAWVAEDDAEFVTEVYSYHMMLKEYSQVAAQKENIPAEVKDFAQASIPFYETSNSQLEAIAIANNWTLPATVGENVVEFKNTLMEREGAEFADDYIDAVNEIQDKMITEYREAAAGAVYPELRAWAATTLPVIEQREARVDELEDLTSRID